MRLRTALLLGVLVLLGALLIGTVAAVSLVLSRAARRNVADELTHHRAAFVAQHRADAALLRSETHVVAEEPRIKAVVASEDVSRETIAGVIFELKRALGSRLFALLDSDGHLIVDATDETGHGLDGAAPVVRALADGDAEGAWTWKGQAFHITAHRLAFGTTVVGLLVLGMPVDDNTAAAFRTQTGSNLAVTLDGRVVAASSDGKSLDRAELARAVVAARDDATPVEVMIGGDRYLLEAAPFPGVSWGGEVRYAVLRSLDAAMAPANRLVRVLYALLLVALLIAWPLAGLFARRLSRPVDALVEFTRQVGAGHLEAKADSGGGTLEVRQLGDAMNRMVGELVELREREASRQRLERELEIATRIQTSILPRDVAVPRLEIAAQMVPAAQVGGDYYDVLPVAGGCWVGIGDVSGHGLPAGLIMLMVQSVVAGVVEHSPNAKPSAALDVLNRVLWSNIRQRLTQDDHVTLSLMRYHASSGEFVFAGAHEEIIVWRAATRTVECIETPGTWIGGMRDVAPFTVDSRLRLGAGDLMILYTDGVTEAMSATREQFGIERLCGAVERAADGGVVGVRDAVLAEVRSFMHEQRDDITLVVMRRES